MASQQMKKCDANETKMEMEERHGNEIGEEFEVEEWFRRFVS